MNAIPSNAPWPRPLPEEVDVDFYRKTYGDLSAMSDDEARTHFADHGRREGREASPHARRGGFQEFARGAKSILEIGPGHRPSFIGAHVRYFDVTDPDGLRARVAHMPDENTGGTPKHIDYVSPTGDLSIVHETFDVVFSAHAIEHQPDLIRHLRDVRRLLNPGGAYLALMPDRRFCFDQTTPRSTLGQVIQAHKEERRTHSIANIIDACMLSTHNDADRHWRGDSPDVAFDIDRARHALSIVESAKDAYIDVHAWRFTSEEMRDVLQALRALALIDVSAIRVFSTPHGADEFGLMLAP